MRQRGSSLILVTLIMAGIVVVVFGAHRLTLVQFNQSNRDEDKIFAYYAAKAGIEDGLIRFRFNRDAETPGGKVHRFDLTNGSNIGEVDEDTSIRSTAGYNPINQYYDLKINFKTDAIGFGGRLPSGRLEKDETLQLTGFSPSQGSDYYLRYAFDFDCLSGGFVQIQQIREQNGDQTVYSQTTVQRPPGGATFDSANSTNLYINSSEGLVNSVRLRAYECAINYSFQTVTSSTGANPAGVEFDGLRTYIISTGYFASIKRTLVAEIDRGTGRLISIYDFNIYSGEGNISPP